MHGAAAAADLDGVAVVGIGSFEDSVETTVLGIAAWWR